MDPVEYKLMDAAEAGMWWYRALHARVVDVLDNAAGAAAPLLDAGCGTGGFLARLPPGRAAIGLEFHPPAAARARSKSGRAVIAGSVNAMPFADASFGTVTSLDVLCHAAVDPDAALAEMVRVLVPGGLLVLNLPAYDWLLSAHDRRVHNIRRFTAGGATRLLAAAGLQQVRARYWNAVLLPLMVAQRKLLARGEAAGSDVTPFPPWADRAFHAATRVEHALAHLGLPFPAGGSILVTARRP